MTYLCIDSCATASLASPSLQLSPIPLQSSGWDLLEKRTASIQAAMPIAHQVASNFTDIPCYGDQIVALQGVSPPIYLHANLVDMEDGSRYIATQYPLLEGQPELFWKVAMQQSDFILDLNSQSLPPYYPHSDVGEWIEFGSIAVQCTILIRPSRGDPLQFFIFNVFDRSSGLKKSIHRAHYTGWPDHGAVSSEDLAELMKRIDGHRKRSSLDFDKPMLIHCRAGVGRTGTFIAARTLAHLISKGWIDSKNLDEAVFRIILNGRRARGPHFVQNEQQLNSILEFGRKLLESSVHYPSDSTPLSIPIASYDMLLANHQYKRHPYQPHINPQALAYLVRTALIQPHADDLLTLRQVAKVISYGRQFDPMATSLRKAINQLSPLHAPNMADIWKGRIIPLLSDRDRRALALTSSSLAPLVAAAPLSEKAFTHLLKESYQAGRGFILSPSTLSQLREALEKNATCTLDLSRLNPLASEIEELIAKISPLHSVRSLNLSGVRKREPESLITLVNACPSLIHLNIQDCSLITDEILERVSAHRPLIESLNILNCHQISGHAIAAFAQKGHLQSLAISDCLHLDEGISALIQHRCPLRQLELKGSSSKVLPAESLAHLIEQSSQLTSLSIHSPSLHLKVQSAIASIHSSLQELRVPLHLNPLLALTGPGGFANLKLFKNTSQTFATAPTDLPSDWLPSIHLQEFYLGGLRATQPLIELLANHCSELHHMPSIITGQDTLLKLCTGCPKLRQIQYEDPQQPIDPAILTLASHCHQLEEVTLVGTITSEQPLIHLLRNNPHIQKLNLIKSQLSSNAYEVLANQRHYIRELHLTGSPSLSEELLHTLLSQSKELRSLSLSNCPQIDTPALKRLQSAHPHVALQKFDN